MSPDDGIPYYSHDKRLLGFVTEAQAVLLVDVRLVRRKKTGELKRVMDLSIRLHPGEFLGRDVTSRSIWQHNDGKCFREEVESGWLYALKGRGI